MPDIGTQVHALAYTCIESTHDKEIKIKQMHTGVSLALDMAN